MDKSILNVVHEGAKEFHDAGLMNDVTLREFDALCLPPVKKYTALQIKRIRTRNRASQAVFAAYLNVSRNLVSDWERGVKRPGGPALRLLSIIQRKGLQAVA